MVEQFSTQVIVAGGGPAGATIARLLALRGWCVTVVDPGMHRTDRLEVLSPSSMPVLEDLGLAEILDDAAISRSCLGIKRCWGGTKMVFDEFLRHPGGVGFVVDRSCLDTRLRELARTAGVTFVQGKVVGIVKKEKIFDVEIRTQGGKMLISADIAVDASGRSSAVARRLGARLLTTEHLIAERVFVERTADRPPEASWLDIENHDANWSYTVSGPSGRKERWVIYRGEDRFRSFGPQRTNASAAHLSQAAGDCWLAVGDAASSFDPITSQGLVNALSTALVATGAILSSGGVTQAAASTYSNAVMATFNHSERGRTAVYGALAAAPRSLESD